MSTKVVLYIVLNSKSVYTAGEVVYGNLIVENQEALDFQSKSWKFWNKIVCKQKAFVLT